MLTPKAIEKLSISEYFIWYSDTEDCVIFIIM